MKRKKVGQWGQSAGNQQSVSEFLGVWSVVISVSQFAKLKVGGLIANQSHLHIITLKTSSVIPWRALHSSTILADHALPRTPRSHVQRSTKIIDRRAAAGLQRSSSCIHNIQTKLHKRSFERLVRSSVRAFKVGVNNPKLTAPSQINLARQYSVRLNNAWSRINETVLSLTRYLFDL